MRNFASLLIAACFTTMSFAPAFADDHGWHHEHDDRGWHGDIHAFHEHDYDTWRGGRWFHGDHEGRFGWWWTVGDGWYSYPSPVYPYPDPYTPPVVILRSAPAPLGIPPTYVYSCPNPAGYYPYVVRCFGAWERVYATAAPVVVTPPPVIVQEPAPVPAMPMGSADSPRDADDRELNRLAVEFQTVDVHGAHARFKLRELEKKVEAFRQTLYTRSYDVIDIIRDADGLEHRIAARREGLPSSHGAPASGEAVPAEPVTPALPQ